LAYTTLDRLVQFFYIGLLYYILGLGRRKEDADESLHRHLTPRQFRENVAVRHLQKTYSSASLLSA